MNLHRAACVTVSPKVTPGTNIFVADATKTQHCRKETRQKEIVSEVVVKVTDAKASCLKQLTGNFWR